MIHLSNPAKLAAALTQGLRVKIIESKSNASKHIIITWGEVYPYSYTKQQMQRDGENGETYTSVDG